MSDALVVGAGPNGLAAAIRLADAGLSVCVLEAQDAPGGAVRTEELTLPGFLHDTFSAVYPAGAASPVLARMGLERHGLEWVSPEACMAHPVDDGPAGVLFAGLDATVASLERRRPGDGEAWARFAAPLLELFGPIRATMLAGFPPVEGPLRLASEGGIGRALAFARLLPGSALGLSRRLFDDPGCSAWLLGAAMHGDTAPDRPGSAIAAAYLNLLGHAVGWPSPRGGAGALTDALVSRLRAAGGELRTGARVVRVHAVGGRVAGVELADGERIGAQTVVADVLPGALAAMAGAALPARYRRALGRFVLGPATIKVDWALDGPIPWSDPAVRGAGTVHVAGTEEEFLRSVHEASTGLPERPFLLLGQQSVADPTRAPEGKHTAWAYTHAPNRGIDWRGKVDPHVARMEAQVERFAPGFRERILARHVLGPADLESRDANLVGGDVGAGSYRLSQTVFRPVVALSPYRTPLRGLYLGSAATFPGGAVHGVPGDAAARAALRDLTPT